MMSRNLAVTLESGLDATRVTSMIHGSADAKRGDHLASTALN